MVKLAQKHRILRAKLKSLDRLLVAYSGGIDSALLLKVAVEVLGRHVLAVTADSPSVPGQELQEAKAIAREIGARHVVIRTDEIQNSGYVQNTGKRCYFCKFTLYAELFRIAKIENIRFIANGTNQDDLGDYRPGLQAADEFEVLSPLVDAGFTKADVRGLARQLGLTIWDKPASPCLASRIPYGSAVTVEKLEHVEAAESFLRSYGIRELRVRHFGSKARIEVAKSHFNTVSKHWRDIQGHFSQLGFDEIDLCEFRSGALNADLLRSEA